MAAFMQLTFDPTMEYDEETRLYTATCKELGIAAIGTTREYAHQSLATVIISYCEALRLGGHLRTAIEESRIDHRIIESNADSDNLFVNIPWIE